MIDDTGLPRWLVRSSAVGLRLLVLATLVWLVAELATRLTLILVAIAVALLLAGVFAPGVARLERRGVRRGLAAGGAVVILLGVVTGLGLAIGSRISEQVPELREQLSSASSDLSDRLGVELPALGSAGSGSSEGSGGAGSGSSGGSGGSGSEGSGTQGSDGAESGSQGGTSGGGSSLMGGAAKSLGVVADVLIGFFLAVALMFLFLKNGPRMWQRFVDLLAGRLRDDVDASGRAAWLTVGAYVRGLTIVALFDAVAIGLGLWALGVPLVLTLAALQFVASYIPTIGSIVAGAVAVAVAYVSGGLGTAAAVLVLALVVQQVGNDVIEPYVMQRTLPIGPVTVLVAVTAGGLLWGIAGALLFVPLAAAVSAALREVWVRHGSPPLAGAG